MVVLDEVYLAGVLQPEESFPDIGTFRSHRLGGQLKPVGAEDCHVIDHDLIRLFSD
jgi:hypothetical protein